MTLRTCLFLICLLPVGLWFAQAATSEPAVEVPRIHESGHDDLVLSIYGKFIAEDYDSIRVEMRKLEDNCRELKIEEREIYGSDVADYDRSFHRALDRTRELAARGEWDDSERQFSWIVRNCIECHRVAREAGVGPPSPLP